MRGPRVLPALRNCFLISPYLLAVTALLMMPLGCGEDKPSTPVAVSVEPSAVSVRVGQTHQFAATATGMSDQSVTWSVDGDSTHGAIDSTGLYTAPDSVPNPAAVTVRATTKADPSKSGTAIITISNIPDLPGFAGVPAGSFTMGDGSSISYCGTQEHAVTLTRDFYLGQTEVTNQQYLAAMQWALNQGYVAVLDSVVYDRLDGRSGTDIALLYLADSGSEIRLSGTVFLLRDAGHKINANHPVKEVTWYGAAAYCDWLSLQAGLPRAYNHETWTCNGGDPYAAEGYRLPTDAEWEYAAQYNDGRIYPWGNEGPDCDRANYYGCKGVWTEPVGSQVAGPEKTILDKGLFDMAGNVREWCNDWHTCSLGTAAAQNPPGPLSGSDRTLRGGSWYTYSGGYLRCADRDGAPPSSKDSYGGVRVARTVAP